MRSVRKPPVWQKGLDEKFIQEAFEHITAVSDVDYLHWDDLVHRTPPTGLTHESWWTVLKLKRLSGASYVPLQSTQHETFKFNTTGRIRELVHRISQQCSGTFQSAYPVEGPDRDQYIIRSLMEEAISSSQIEGAITTRRVAKEMLQSGRKPLNHSEQMIANNYSAMKEIVRRKGEKLSADFVFQLHRILTEETLEDPSEAGRFRNEEDQIVVQDAEGNVHHTPPPAHELPERMERMIAFANGEEPGEFLEPPLRAIILHFWLAYDHPFTDGNGRTARALFYWAMLHYEYWLFEFVPISETIRKSKMQYYRAFLHTESDENDLTYFILYHLEAIQKAVHALHQVFQRKQRELRNVAELLQTSNLNHRQRSLITEALKHPNRVVTFRSHMGVFGIVYQTARTDLLELADLGLFVATKKGKMWEFYPAPDLGNQIRKA